MFLVSGISAHETQFLFLQLTQVSEFFDIRTDEEYNATWMIIA